MENFGYRNMSQYARDCMIRDDLSTYKLLKEIYDKIIGDRECPQKEVGKKPGKVRLG